MKALFFCLIFLSSTAVFGQLDNTSFDQRLAIEPADSNKLYAGLRLLAFGKNNEYFETTISGYTLFGYQFNPYVYYQLGEKVRIDIGAYLQKDFGNNRFSTVLPTLSLKIKHQHFSTIIGTLEGATQHQLIEPLYDFENVLNKRLEEGVQILWMKDGLFLDAWVNWEKMIYFNDPDQERFVAGLSFSKRIADVKGWIIEVPLQATIRHAGGQIDVSPQPLRSDFSSAIGLTISKKLHAAVQAYGVKSYFLTNQSLTNRIVPYKDGNGIYINPYLQTRFGLSLMGTYWYGNEFLNSDGSQIFPVSTERYPNIVQPARVLYMLRFLYEKKITEGLSLTARVEPFYDTYPENIQYSYGFYLNFNDQFFLGHAKKK